MLLKKIFTGFIFTFCTVAGFAQTHTCTTALDSAAVIKIAKKYNAYWEGNSISKPTLSFDQKNCTWTVVSFKTEHTNEGDCKHTNGCTKLTSVTLVIDAHKKRVKSRKEKVKVSPNYE